MVCTRESISSTCTIQLLSVLTKYYTHLYDNIVYFSDLIRSCYSFGKYAIIGIEPSGREILILGQSHSVRMRGWGKIRGTRRVIGT